MALTYVGFPLLARLSVRISFIRLLRFVVLKLIQILLTSDSPTLGLQPYLNTSSIMYLTFLVYV